MKLTMLNSGLKGLICSQPCLFSSFIPPIEVKPGDSIDVTCHFKTTYKTETIYYGESTADEMCTGYVSYYPAIAKLDECMAFNDEAK